MEDRQGVPLWAIVSIVVASLIAIAFIGNWLKRRREGRQERPADFWHGSVILQWIVVISGLLILARACSLYR